MELSLNLDEPRRVGEASFAVIVSLFRATSPQLIVEFGSGASTVRLAIAIPSAKIVSIEHEATFYLQTRMLIEQSNARERINLQLCPLMNIWLHGQTFRSYSPPVLPRRIDCLFIDGPSYFTRRGREACLYYAYSHLSVGGVVVLDGLERSDERAIVQNWLARFLDGETGLLVPPGNAVELGEALVRLLSNPDKIDEFGRAGRLRAAQFFSLKKFVDTYEVLFKDLVGQRRGSRSKSIPQSHSESGLNSSAIGKKTSALIRSRLGG